MLCDNETGKVPLWGLMVIIFFTYVRQLSVHNIELIPVFLLL